MKYPLFSGQFDFYKNDIIAVLKLVLLLLVIFAGIRALPSLIDKWLNRNLTQHTFGIVTTIEPNKYIKEALEGGKVSTKGYLVEFNYFIDNQFFNTENYIDKSTLNLIQKANIRNVKTGDTLIVKYNPQNPKNARLVIEKFTH